MVLNARFLIPLIGMFPLVSSNAQIGTPNPWGMACKGDPIPTTRVTDYASMFSLSALNRFKGQFGEPVYCAYTDTMALCFDPATPPEYVEWVINNLPINGPSGQFNPGTRWSSTSYGATGSTGTPISLRWSIVPDGVSIPGSAGEPTSANVIAAQFSAAAGFGSTIWITKLAEGFDRWHQLSGLTYTQVTDDGASFSGSAGRASAPIRGDVRIAGHNIDGASGILAYTFYPNTGDQVFDTGDRGNFKGPSNNYRLFRNTHMHEHGHGIGFGHVWPTSGTKLMEPYLNTGFDGPQDDDTRAGMRYYGDILEPNGTSATATNLGSPTGGVTHSNLGTSTSSDSDYFKFTVPAYGTVSVTVTPIGSTYTVGNSSSSTASINTKTIKNLTFEIRDTNGSTVLLTKNDTAAGSAETVANYALPPAPGTYFLRVVDVAGSVNDIQRYSLTVSTGTAPLTLSGTVLLDSFLGNPALVPVTLDILNVGTNTVVWTTGITGGVYSEAPGIASGTYDVRFSSAYRFLTKRVANVNLSGAAVVNVTLLNGDVDGNNTIDTFDLNAIFSEFGSSGPYPTGLGWTDLDGNGTTDIYDLNMVFGGFGNTGDN